MDQWKDKVMTLSNLKAIIFEFNEFRGWNDIHTAKDLAMAVSIEANELLELFLWKQDLPEKTDIIWTQNARNEIADVMICLINLASKLGIDIASSVAHKLVLNAIKYPVVNKEE